MKQMKQILSVAFAALAIVGSVCGGRVQVASHIDSGIDAVAAVVNVRVVVREMVVADVDAAGVGAADVDGAIVAVTVPVAGGIVQVNDDVVETAVGGYVIGYVEV